MTATTIINNRRSSSYNNDDGDGEVYYIPTNNEEQQQQYNNNNNNNNNDYDDLSTTTTIEKEEEEKVVLTNVAVVIDTNNNEDELDDACHRLIQQLDDTQKEQAARYSYKYFVQSESLSGNTTSRQQQQLLYAKKMARNHIIAENGNINKALNRLKETLVFRQEIIQIDNMRKCFNPLYKYNNNNDDDVDDYDDVDDDGPMTSNEVILPYEELRQGYNPLYKCTKYNKTNKTKDAVVDDDDDDDVLPYEELRHGLYDHMGDNDGPRAILQGYDKDGRAIYLIKMHNYKYFCLPKFYNHLHYYLLDRALAATEERTNGKQSKIMVIFDYSLPQYNNNRRNSKNNIIPYNVAKTFIHNFERYWPETCYKIILLDTPFLFRGASFWTTMIKPLLDPNTKEKIVFLNDGYDKEATLRKLIDKSQASPIMLINGQMKRKFDKSEFFERTPYNHIFNE